MWLQGPSVTVRLTRLSIGCNLSSLNMPTHIGVFPRWMSLPLWNLLRGTDPPVTKEGVTAEDGITGSTVRRHSQSRAWHRKTCGFAFSRDFGFHPLGSTDLSRICPQSCQTSISNNHSIPQ